MTIRILIADDHGVLRAGLRALLNAEPDLEVIGEAAEGPEAVRLAETLRPDVLLLDLSMPGPGGAEVIRAVKQRSPDTRVLVLTVHEEESLLRAALQAGAAGYIVKRAAEAELISAIRAVWQGDLYVHPAMMRALLKNIVPRGPTAAEPLMEPLTPRETDVLRLLAQGYSNSQIAAQLTVSVRTVEGHRANLMQKLNLHSRAELVRYAQDQHFL